MGVGVGDLLIYRYRFPPVPVFSQRVTWAISPVAGIAAVGGGEARTSQMSKYVRFLAPLPFNDDAGHLRGKWFGGSVDPLNLVPMSPRTNRAVDKTRPILWWALAGNQVATIASSAGCFYDAELAVSRMVAAGCAPRIEIEVSYAVAPPAANAGPPNAAALAAAPRPGPVMAGAAVYTPIGGGGAATAEYNHAVALAAAIPAVVDRPTYFRYYPSPDSSAAKLRSDLPYD